MLNQNGGSRMETVVKLTLVFIISLLSFSVGTFVGKQFSDQQHKTAHLEHGESANRSTASIAPDTMEVKPEKALTDADIAAISADFAQAEKDDIDALLAGNEAHNAAPAEAAAHQEPSHQDNSKLTTEEKIEAMLMETASESKQVEVKPTVEVKKEELPQLQAAQKRMEHKAEKPDMVANTAEALAKEQAPTVKDKPQPSRIPTSLPANLAASSLGKFTVQVASYQKKEDAEKHSDRLKSQGYSAFYLDVQVKGATWYRVNVGLFADQDKAKVFRSQLMKEANLKSALVQKITQ